MSDHPHHLFCLGYHDHGESHHFKRSAVVSYDGEGDISDIVEKLSDKVPDAFHSVNLPVDNWLSEDELKNNYFCSDWLDMYGPYVLRGVLQTVARHNISRQAHIMEKAEQWMDENRDKTEDSFNLTIDTLRQAELLSNYSDDMLEQIKKHIKLRAPAVIELAKSQVLSPKRSQSAPHIESSERKVSSVAGRSEGEAPRSAHDELYASVNDHIMDHSTPELHASTKERLDSSEDVSHHESGHHLTESLKRQLDMASEPKVVPSGNKHNPGNPSTPMPAPPMSIHPMTAPSMSAAPIAVPQILAPQMFHGPYMGLPPGYEHHYVQGYPQFRPEMFGPPMMGPREQFQYPHMMPLMPYPHNPYPQAMVEAHYPQDMNHAPGYSPSVSVSQSQDETQQGPLQKQQTNHFKQGRKHPKKKFTDDARLLHDESSQVQQSYHSLSPQTRQNQNFHHPQDAGFNKRLHMQGFDGRNNFDLHHASSPHRSSVGSSSYGSQVSWSQSGTTADRQHPGTQWSPMYSNAYHPINTYGSPDDPSHQRTHNTYARGSSQENSAAESESGVESFKAPFDGADNRSGYSSSGFRNTSWKSNRSYDRPRDYSKLWVLMLRKGFHKELNKALRNLSGMTEMVEKLTRRESAPHYQYWFVSFESPEKASEALELLRRLREGSREGEQAMFNVSYAHQCDWLPKPSFGGGPASHDDTNSTTNAKDKESEMPASVEPQVVSTAVAGKHQSSTPATPNRQESTQSNEQRHAKGAATRPDSESAQVAIVKNEPELSMKASDKRQESNTRLAMPGSQQRQQESSEDEQVLIAPEKLPEKPSPSVPPRSTKNKSKKAKSYASKHDDPDHAVYSEPPTNNLRAASSSSNRVTTEVKTDDSSPKAQNNDQNQAPITSTSGSDYPTLAEAYKATHTKVAVRRDHTSGSTTTQFPDQDGVATKDQSHGGTSAQNSTTESQPPFPHREEKKDLPTKIRDNITRITPKAENSNETQFKLATKKPKKQKQKNNEANMKPPDPESVDRLHTQPHAHNVDAPKQSNQSGQIQVKDPISNSAPSDNAGVKSRPDNGGSKEGPKAEAEHAEATFPMPKTSDKQKKGTVTLAVAGKTTTQKKKSETHTLSKDPHPPTDLPGDHVSKVAKQSKEEVGETHPSEEVDSKTMQHEPTVEKKEIDPTQLESSTAPVVSVDLQHSPDKVQNLADDAPATRSQQDPSMKVKESAPARMAPDTAPVASSDTQSSLAESRDATNRTVKTRANQDSAVTSKEKIASAWLGPDHNSVTSKETQRPPEKSQDLTDGSVDTHSMPKPEEVSVESTPELEKDDHPSMKGESPRSSNEASPPPKSQSSVAVAAEPISTHKKSQKKKKSRPGSLNLGSKKSKRSTSGKSKGEVSPEKQDRSHSAQSSINEDSSASRNSTPYSFTRTDQAEVLGTEAVKAPGLEPFDSLERRGAKNPRPKVSAVNWFDLNLLANKQRNSESGDDKSQTTKLLIWPPPISTDLENSNDSPSSGSVKYSPDNSTVFFDQKNKGKDADTRKQADIASELKTRGNDNGEQLAWSDLSVLEDSHKDTVTSGKNGHIDTVQQGSRESSAAVNHAKLSEEDTVVLEQSSGNDSQGRVASAETDQEAQFQTRGVESTRSLPPLPSLPPTPFDKSVDDYLQHKHKKDGYATAVSNAKIAELPDDSPKYAVGDFPGREDASDGEIQEEAMKTRFLQLSIMLNQQEQSTEERMAGSSNVPDSLETQKVAKQITELEGTVSSPSGSLYFDTSTNPTQPDTGSTSQRSDKAASLGDQPSSPETIKCSDLDSPRRGSSSPIEPLFVTPREFFERRVNDTVEEEPFPPLGTVSAASEKSNSWSNSPARTYSDAAANKASPSLSTPATDSSPQQIFRQATNASISPMPRRPSWEVSKMDKVWGSKAGQTKR